MVDTTEPKTQAPILAAGDPGNDIRANELLTRLSCLAQMVVESRAVAAQPGSPNDGEAWIIASSPTGAIWSTFQAGDIAFYFQGWVSWTAPVGCRALVEDESMAEVRHDGSGVWTLLGRTSVATGITASTTQTQGQQPLTARFNHVSTCANANDTVTLAAAVKGAEQVIENAGAQTLQVFPASGDSIGAGAADASTTIASAASARFIAVDATNWRKL